MTRITATLLLCFITSQALASQDISPSTLLEEGFLLEIGSRDLAGAMEKYSEARELSEVSVIRTISTYRIAHCLAGLGRMEEAQKTLETLNRDFHPSSHVAGRVRDSLARFQAPKTPPEGLTRQLSVVGPLQRLLQILPSSIRLEEFQADGSQKFDRGLVIDLVCHANQADRKTILRIKDHLEKDPRFHARVKTLDGLKAYVAIRATGPFNFKNRPLPPQEVAEADYKLVQGTLALLAMKEGLDVGTIQITPGDTPDQETLTAYFEGTQLEKFVTSLQRIEEGIPGIMAVMFNVTPILDEGRPSPDSGWLGEATFSLKRGSVTSPPEPLGPKPDTKPEAELSAKFIGLTGIISGESHRSVIIGKKVYTIGQSFTVEGRTFRIVEIREKTLFVSEKDGPPQVIKKQ